MRSDKECDVLKKNEKCDQQEEEEKEENLPLGTRSCLPCHTSLHVSHLTMQRWIIRIYGISYRM